MTELFLKIMDMSVSAGWIVLAVLILRAVLRKAPKWIRGLLWGMVAVRLLCPFAVESSFSAVPQLLGSGALTNRWMNHYTGGVRSIHDDSDQYEAAGAAGRVPIPAKEGGYDMVTADDRLGEPSTIKDTVMPVLAAIWGIGVFLLLLCAAVSCLRLRRSLGSAVRYRDNIFQSEHIDVPFVFGIIRPRIYLPYKMDGLAPAACVIAHEQAHICRKDHWWKPLGYLLLSVHWFNPLIWLAYVLFCRDIELACDEKVIKGLDHGRRADYTQALLSCSVSRPVIAACPLAFGEAGVKERVRAVMNYKKPAFWTILVSVAVCMLAAVCFLTNPKRNQFDIKIVIPAGSQEQFVYSHEEISPVKNEITVLSGDGLGDTEVVLRPAETNGEYASSPVYLTPGMSVKIDGEKGGWFQIGVNVQNQTDEDMVVYVKVKGVEVRIADSADDDLEQYRTEYIGDAVKVSAIAQRLSYPEEYSYESIELQTDEEPYELIVYLSGDGNGQEADFKKCADTAFGLIGNMGRVSFCDADTEKVMFSFAREE